jgi:glutamate carboxypeptidase
VNKSTVHSFLQENLSRYLDIHRQMVEINSFTANPTGVNALARLTANLFAGLGFQSELVPSENPRYGSHLFMKRSPAEGSGSVLALVSHLDTVFPAEEERTNNFTWRVEGERIYGPGSVDIKGGSVLIYMLLEAIRKFAPQQFESTTWHVAMNATEEVLSDEFAGLCLQHFPVDTLACLVFEGGTPSGEVYPLVTARKGRATFRVSAEGRSAHAGNNHHLGANAILQMAHTVQKIAALTNYLDQITFNVGTIHGGVVVNRVPHHAEVEVEMRAFSPQVYADGIRAMLALDGTSEVASRDNYPCKVSVEVCERTEPWPQNASTQRLFTSWERAAASLGVRVAHEARGGLSDGNLLWRHFPTLDGLGPSGMNAHCSEKNADGSKDQEYALQPSFVPKALLNYTAILELLDLDSKAANS